MPRSELWRNAGPVATSVRYGIVLEVPIQMHLEMERIFHPIEDPICYEETIQERHDLLDKYASTYRKNVGLN